MLDVVMVTHIADRTPHHHRHHRHQYHHHQCHHHSLSQKRRVRIYSGAWFVGVQE
jgi:hypothetical protein